MKRYYLGIDLGTSSVKVLAFDSECNIVGEVSREYPVYYPHDKWAEQEPKDWWLQTVEAIRELISSNNIPKDAVASIGFSGQMHGLVALDKENAVLFPAILWCDNRTEEECEEITAFFTPEGLREATANKALTGFTAPKILWVKKHRPELFEQIEHILLPKDYIRLMLTGDYVMDVSDAAGTLMLDVKNRIWSEPMIDYIGIKRSALPKLCESYEVTGRVSDAVKEMLSLEGDILVVGGGGDNAVGAVGAGVVNEGTALVTLGTSGVIFVPSESFAVDEACQLHVFCDATGKYHSMGVILSAANSLKWWTEMHQEHGIERLLEEAEKVPCGSDKVIFMPHLMGERFDINTKGVFLGLSATTTRGHMTRAILEGVAFHLKDSLEILRSLNIEVHTVRIIGGGSKSLMWKQIIADVMALPVEEINTSQGGALGAAILAAVGDGFFKTVSEGCDAMIHVTDTLTPISANVAAYEKAYRLYAKAYPSLKQWFKEANDVELEKAQ